MEQMTNEQYAKQGGPKCPFCHSSNIEGRQIEHHGECITQDIACLDCKKEWYDMFHLVGYEEAETV